MTTFQDKVKALRAHREESWSCKNKPVEWEMVSMKSIRTNLTQNIHHWSGVDWMRRATISHAAHHDECYLNSFAIKWNGKYLLVVRVEGADRKSFFAVAECPNGVDNFRFWDEPITMPEDVGPATNIYDMRLTAHEDGYIYGVFCAESHDDAQPGDPSAATATAAIARTKDLVTGSAFLT